MSSEYDDSFEMPHTSTDDSLFALALVNLFAIILSFFIVLFSFSSFHAKKSENTVKGVKGTFSKELQEESEVGIEQETTGIEPLKQYYAEAKKYARDALEIDETRIVEEGNRLIMRLPVEILFATDSAMIDDRKLFLERMADGMEKDPVGRQLDVEFVIGKEQAVAPGTTPLSVLRSGAFARKMISLGISEERVFVGVNDADPAFLVLTFYPRDETRSAMEFE